MEKGGQVLLLNVGGRLRRGSWGKKLLGASEALGNRGRTGLEGGHAWEKLSGTCNDAVIGRVMNGNE